MATGQGIFNQAYQDWQSQLRLIVETMREMSQQTDPQETVQAYIRRMRSLLKIDGSVSLSRRDLSPPQYCITRYTGWKESINPWRDKARLPVLSGGILAELLYGDQARILDDFQANDDDPAATYLAGQRSLMAIPLFDQGVALNMVVLLLREPHGFDPQTLPQMVWMSNLFGRATHSLILSEELQEAYRSLDRELKVVADIQRSLLPTNLPRIPTLDLAAHYQTSRRAGGDYYDFLPLPDGQWGILIADVSGHGTPAAVIMAVMHSIVHTYPGPPTPPGRLLTYVNRKLAERYTTNGTFITAFYGIYNTEKRELIFASAGHPQPRLKRCSDGSVHSLNGAGGLPLGVSLSEEYVEARHVFQPGDQIVFYTDGITEARNSEHEMFGLDGLDNALSACGVNAANLIQSLLDAVKTFTAGSPPDDDRTLIVAKVS